MTVELQCVKCKARVSPLTAHRRAKHPGLCACGGAFRVRTVGPLVGTKPAAPPMPGDTVTCPNCGTVLFGAREPLPPVVFPAGDSGE